MTRKRRYKKFLPGQSVFSQSFATWANNHRGRAKMKQTNRRRAKRREAREWQAECAREQEEQEEQT